MHTMIKSRPWLATWLIIAFLVTGCGVPRLPSAGLPDDGPPIVTSEAAARRFVEKVAAAGESAVQTREVRLTVTQEEVSSFLEVATDLSDQMRLGEAQNLRDLDLEQVRQAEGLPQWLRDMAAEQELPDVRLPDLQFRISIQQPTVYFDDGRVIVRGYAEALGQRQPLRLVLAPSIADGALILDFVEGKLGPVPVPEALVDSAAREIASLLLASQDYIQITEVHAGGGTLTLAGRYTG